MRRTILAMGLAVVMAPAAARAQQPDGGPPDGTAISTTHELAERDQTDQYDNAGHTGSSSDPNGNMGNTGRTGRPDGGASEQNGAEGSTGSRHDDSRQDQPPP
jgi:hypothetical protein